MSVHRWDSVSHLDLQKVLNYILPFLTKKNLWKGIIIHGAAESCEYKILSMKYFMQVTTRPNWQLNYSLFSIVIRTEEDSTLPYA